jgi:predicted GIY-YIG superfamily endonuclease
MPNPKGGFVYILASRPNGTLYVGVTNDALTEGRK